MWGETRINQWELGQWSMHPMEILVKAWVLGFTRKKEMLSTGDGDVIWDWVDEWELVAAV